MNSQVWSISSDKKANICGHSLALLTLEIKVILITKISGYMYSLSAFFSEQGIYQSKYRNKRIT